MNRSTNTTHVLSAIQADYASRIAGCEGQLQEQVQVNTVLVDMLREQEFAAYYSTFPYVLFGLGVVAGLAGQCVYQWWNNKERE